MQITSLADSAAASAQAQSARTDAAVQKLQSVGSDKTEIRKAAEDFEAIFITQMLGHMFKGMETNKMFGGGQAENIYRDLLVDEYGKTMAGTGGLGLADSIERQLISLQEVN